MPNITKRSSVKVRGGTGAAKATLRLSAYDGHHHLGTITGSPKAGFKASPPHGAGLGTFKTIKAAADSLSAVGAVR